MRQQLSNSDRGAGLVEYALIVVFVAMVSMVGVKAIGEETSDTFDAVGNNLAAADEETELSPEEKWEQAKKDYDDAIAEAKAQKADDLANAKSTFDAAKEANKDLPKDERKAANQEAKAEYNSSKDSANDNYKSAVQDAKDARDAAKSEYKNSK